MRRMTRTLAGPLMGALLIIGLAGGCGSDGGPAGGDAGAVDPVPIWQAKGAAVLAGAGCNGHPKTCPGATGPDFTLKDFNPTSATLGQEVALSFGGTAKGGGKPRVVALLAGW